MSRHSCTEAQKVLSALKQATERAESVIHQLAQATALDGHQAFEAPPILAGKVDEIIEKIKANGLSIVAHKIFHLSTEAAKSFYAEHQEKIFFGDLTDFMTR